MPIVAEAWGYTRLPRPPGVHELVVVVVTFIAATVLVTVFLRRSLAPLSRRAPRR